MDDVAPPSTSEARCPRALPSTDSDPAALQAQVAQLTEQLEASEQITADLRALLHQARANAAVWQARARVAEETNARLDATVAKLKAAATTARAAASTPPPPSSSSSPRLTTVQFDPGSLGLKLDYSERGTIVVGDFFSFLGPGAMDQAEASGRVAIGDEIVAVDGRSVEGMSIRDFRQALGSGARPHRVTFRSSLGDASAVA